MPERYFRVSEHMKPSKKHCKTCPATSAVLHFFENGINLTEPRSKRVSKNTKTIAKNHRKTKGKSTSGPLIDLKSDAKSITFPISRRRRFPLAPKPYVSNGKATFLEVQKSLPRTAGRTHGQTEILPGPAPPGAGRGAAERRRRLASGQPARPLSKKYPVQAGQSTPFTPIQYRI